jgi:transposase
VHTISNEDNAGRGGRRRRRAHSAEFKAQVVAACSAPGASAAAVAMAHGVNANLARRWVVAARRPGGRALAEATASSAVPAAFVPVQLPPAEAAPADIRVELRRGVTVINVSWPCTAASDCAAWMRELLR